MIYCKRCVYPIIAVNLEINDDGICSSCKTFVEFNKLTEVDWDNRKKKFEKIINEIRKKDSNYQCLIPVSGGKDSYYQAHVIAKEYNLKPLLVTYHGNNFLAEGDYNRDRMRDVFDADHIVWGPSIQVLKKLNRLGFEKLGDMNWQNHCGIFTSPISIAVKFDIEHIFWGEIAWDISGMYGPDDFVEFSARVRHEHALRGYEWFDFIKSKKEKLRDIDMIWAKYPSDEEILKSNVKGYYIGNFFKWNPNKHVKLVTDKYGWKQKETPYQRTYRQFSNLDDKYESGVHDLLKFIKFGYGRASDHASKDIRDGYMTRDEGVEKVKKYDHVISDDLYEWLEYVERDEKYFWKIADTFRDPRVWKIKKKEWYKDNLWGNECVYGPVHLDNDQITEFNLKQKKLFKNF
jgi:N-acetyl sugar amidotransferase